MNGREGYKMGLKKLVKRVLPQEMLDCYRKLRGKVRGKVNRILFKIISIFDKRKLCVIWVDGGLGSQINKLALGLNMEMNGYLVKYDFSVFKQGQKDLLGINNRNYDLDKVYAGKILEASSLECKYTKEINHFHCQNLYDFNEDLFHLKAPVYISGYFDNIKYWNNVKEILKERCFFSRNCSDAFISLQNEILNNSNAVVLHARRGDYVNTIFDVTTQEYFIKAIHKFKEKLKNPTFYIFSNDNKWVKENLIKGLPDFNLKVVELSTNDTGYDDIALMNCARNFILSNSSFSIMGAFFSRYDEINIIMPNRWFAEIPKFCFDGNYNQDEFDLLSQKVHDINGKTLFLGC